MTMQSEVHIQLLELEDLCLKEGCRFRDFFSGQIWEQTSARFLLCEEEALPIAIRPERPVQVEEVPFK